MCQGDDAEYAAAATEEAEFWTAASMMNEAKQQTRTNSGHLNIVLGNQVTAANEPDTCECAGVKNHNVIWDVGVYSSSESYNFDQAVHEYAHAYQSVHGNSLAPTWANEGGADHLTCMMIHNKPASYDPSGSSTRTYRDCICEKLKESWPYNQRTAPSDGKSILEKYAHRYTASNAYETDYSLASGTAFHPLLYSMGTAATVYAIHKNGGGVGSQEYWIGSTSPWVTNNVTDYIDDVNYATDFAFNQPDTRGWNKAFLAFAKYDSMSKFYEDFDAWYRALPDPSTDYSGFCNGVKAILESDSSIQTQAAAKYVDQNHVNLAHVDYYCSPYYIAPKPVATSPATSPGNRVVAGAVALVAGALGFLLA